MAVALAGKCVYISRAGLLDDDKSKGEVIAEGKAL